MSCTEGTSIEVKHGEIKTLKFTYTKNGSPQDITAATLTMQLKENAEDASPALEIADGSFTKAANVAEAVLDTTSLTAGVKYLGEIKAVFGSGTDEDKSETFYVDVQEAIIT